MQASGPPDLQALFARANQAFAGGDLATARAAAVELVRHAPRAPMARHLLALIEKRRGDRAAARVQFAAAVELAPGDPDIRNNFGNLLSDLGEADAALVQYRRAVALRPGFVDALLNLGQTARDAEAFDEARAAFEAAARLAPGNPAIWRFLAVTLQALGELDAAAAAADRALALTPADPVAAHARARIEAQRGGDARPHFDRASALAPGNPDLLLDRVAAEAADDPVGAADRLAAAVAAAPGWLAGQRALARLRWELGDGHATRGFEEALSQAPAEPTLWYGLLATLNEAERHADMLAVIDRARSALPRASASMLDQFEAIAADEAGDRARAAALFARIGDLDDPTLRIARLRHLLRTGDAGQAARLAEAMVAARPDDRFAWAYLSTAWALTGDPRRDWLDGDERLVRAVDLDLDLDALARRLRELHVTRAAPLEQSLRGGTQTGGDLLARAEPLFRDLRAAFERAVADYAAGLPPPDPRHPTLKEPRERPRIVGGWSVRLTGGGFHVAHVHPRGWLSSAFYVALPDARGAGDPPAGWLALGSPPAELGVDLAPLRLIEPRPGRLALFPSTMWHGTLPFAAGERLTVAFDVAPRRG